QVRAARFDAVGDQDDHLATLGREVLCRQLQRQRYGRGALGLRVADGLQQRPAVDALHGDQQVRVLAGVRVAGPTLSAVDPQAYVEALVLRQGGDQLGEYVLGRHDPVAAVLELVELGARGVADQLDAGGLSTRGALTERRRCAEGGDDQEREQESGRSDHGPPRRRDARARWPCALVPEATLRLRCRRCQAAVATTAGTRVAVSACRCPP